MKAIWKNISTASFEFLSSLFASFLQGNANEEPNVCETRSPFVNDGQNGFCFDPR